LDSIFRFAWFRDTAHPSCQDIWTPENPAVGQCAVTALVVQELLGGTISRLSFSDGMVIYHNLVQGNVIDLTFDQHTPEKQTYYRSVQPDIQVRTRERLLANADTNYRYRVLRSRVMRWLGA
jgi:hypothetical protein